MKSNLGTALIFICVFLVHVACCAAKDKSISAEALVARARSAEVWAEGTPPMSLKAELQVAGANGTIAQGDYNFDWVSPTEWREEIRFANYERLRVRDANGYWQKGTLDYQPALIQELSGILYLKDVLRVRSMETFGRVKNRERDGLQQKCVEMNSSKFTVRVLCFDDRNGTLSAIENPQVEHQSPPQISHIEFGDFRLVGGRLIPCDIRALKDGKVITTVKTLEITEIKEVNRALFNPPANSVLWPQCDDIRDAEVVDRVPVKYSPPAGISGAAHVSVVYAVVEADGSLSHLTVIRGEHPDLNKAVLEAFPRWRYKPAQCGQTAIRVETTFEFEVWVHK
jgi:TonB family protein